MKQTAIGLISTFLLLILFIAGCTSTKPRFPGTCKGETGLAEELVARVRTLYPERFNALHHAGLHIRGKTLVLKGFLKVDRKNREMRLVAQGEMGGTLFEVHLRDGDTAVTTNTGVLKKDWIENSAAADLKHLYAVPEFINPSACRSGGQVTLYDHREKRVTAYVFKVQTDAVLRLSEVRVLNKRRLEYKIEYDYGAQNAELPGFVKITNNINRYSLDINVRYMTPLQ